MQDTSGRYEEDTDIPSLQERVLSRNQVFVQVDFQVLFFINPAFAKPPKSDFCQSIPSTKGYAS